MSYCRFSSDNWKSDVYCYSDCSGGYTIHVARGRHAAGVPIPELPLYKPGGADEWFDAMTAQQKWLSEARLEPIGLSRDGSSSNVETAAEAADLLESLRDEGYRVPAHAIEALRREALEGDAP